MAGQERIIGDDGELLEQFSSTTNTSDQDIEQTKKSIRQAEIAQENKFLVLMREWEQKKPLPGMVKEFRTFGRGKDRTVFCVNPFYDQNDRSVVSYLALTRGGFFEKAFYGLYIQSEVVNYALNPLKDSPPINSKYATNGNSFYDKMQHKLFLFSTLLKNQSLCRVNRWKFSSDDQAVFVDNKRMKIGNTTYESGHFTFDFKSIGIVKAWEIFNGIQDRVKGIYDQKVEELKSKLERRKEEVSSLNILFGSDKKKIKRG